MTPLEIQEHNNQYFDEESMKTWMLRKVLTIGNIRVPEYIHNGIVDPTDHSTAISKQIIKYKDHFKGRKFLDIGTCAGINNIILTQAGFEVVGLDNNIYSLNAALYTMYLNETYYKVVLGNHNDIEKMDYDILLVNQMDYIPGFMENLKPILEREKQKGRASIVLVRG